MCSRCCDPNTSRGITFKSGLLGALDVLRGEAVDLGCRNEIWGRKMRCTGVLRGSVVQSGKVRTGDST